MDTNFNDVDAEEKVEIRRSGSNVTWIFKNSENQPVELDMSFIRANTLKALLKRSINMGRSNEMKPRVLHGTQTELHVFPDHYDIVFDENPTLKLVRSTDQVSALIRDLEEAA
jgi:hypothetical protein